MSELTVASCQAEGRTYQNPHPASETRGQHPQAQTERKERAAAGTPNLLLGATRLKTEVKVYLSNGKHSKSETEN